MVQLQKAILTVGMFSMFEANLQDILGCKNGFARAKEILKNKGQSTTKERFDDLCCAINVLKHGRGDSYNTLVKKAKNLPFRVKLPHESFSQRVMYLRCQHWSKLTMNLYYIA
ncbi:hypothetical protein PGH45_05695 [Legionella pneumophila]|nr:hypothetical protein [Legionella pneumophila]